MYATNAKKKSRRIFLSDGNRSALPAELIYIAASIALSMSQGHITTAANLRPKEFWIKPTIIFVISSDLNKQENLPALLIREPKISWNRCLKKVDINPLCHFEVPHTRDHTPQESLCHFDRREKS